MMDLENLDDSIQHYPPYHREIASNINEDQSSSGEN